MPLPRWLTADGPYRKDAERFLAGDTCRLCGTQPDSFDPRYRTPVCLPCGQAIERPPMTTHVLLETRDSNNDLVHEAFALDEGDALNALAERLTELHAELGDTIVGPSRAIAIALADHPDPLETSPA